MQTLSISLASASRTILSPDFAVTATRVRLLVVVRVTAPPTFPSTFGFDSRQSDSDALSCTSRSDTAGQHGQFLLHRRQEGACPTRDQIANDGQSTRIDFDRSRRF